MGTWWFLGAVGPKGSHPLGALDGCSPLVTFIEKFSFEGGRLSASSVPQNPDSPKQ